MESPLSSTPCAKPCAKSDVHASWAAARFRSLRSARFRTSLTLRLCFPRSREADLEISRSPTSLVARLPTASAACSPKAGWVIRACRPWPPIGLRATTAASPEGMVARSLDSVVQRPVQARVHPAEKSSAPTPAPAAGAAWDASVGHSHGWHGWHGAPPDSSMACDRGRVTDIAGHAGITSASVCGAGSRLSASSSEHSSSRMTSWEGAWVSRNARSSRMLVKEGRYSLADFLRATIRWLVRASRSSVVAGRAP